MSATVLVQGKLFREPESKTSGKGNSYAMATIRVGQGDDATWWRVFAFSSEARDELLTLHNGDAVAVSGSLKAELYDGSGKPRVSLSVTADRLISGKRKKREAAAETRATKKVERTEGAQDYPFDDRIPF